MDVINGDPLTLVKCSAAILLRVAMTAFGFLVSNVDLVLSFMECVLEDIGQIPDAET